MDVDGLGGGAQLARLREVLGSDARWSSAEIEQTEAGLEVQRGRARVLLVEAKRLIEEPDLAVRAVRGDFGLLILGEAPASLKELVKPGSAVAVLDDGVEGDQAFLAIDGLLERVELKQHAANSNAELSRYRSELAELVTIARAISEERDIDRLLSLILEKSRSITGAEAGSLYVVEPSASDPTTRCLRFKLSQNDAVNFAAQEFSLPLSLRSIAGAAALIKQPINTPDVYALDETKPYRFDRSFDERTGYRTHSLLTVPLISAQDEVIGVIQLINRREAGRVEPFDARSEELAITVAAQAGIALENALLYAEIRHIFEGFVRASVQAIEQRDPTTSGHSQRVSIFCCALAEQVDRIDRGPYRDTRFSARDMRELEYAALLHDFGKIGVREEVLVKAKKLYPHQAEAIRGRIAYAIKCAELDLYRERLRLGAEADPEALERTFEARRRELQEAWQTIEVANEPSVLRQAGIARIAELGKLIYPGIDGSPRSLLDPDEVIALQIPRGSLSPSEYDQIRSHVVHTYNFLSKIPWGKSMANLPLIAGAHHERIDGSGYPNGWRAEQIPVPSKIMAIADVYDALTAADRPYKRALPSARAFEILEAEVRDGHFDEELVRLFREAKIYRSAPPPSGLD